MVDANLSTFSGAASDAVLASDYPLTDEQVTRIDNVLSSGPLSRLARRRVYERLLAENAKLPDGTAISSLSLDAIPWQQIIQLLVTLIPTLIPLICPPKPQPSLPATGG